MSRSEAKRGEAKRGEAVGELVSARTLDAGPAIGHHDAMQPTERRHGRFCACTLAGAGALVIASAAISPVAQAAAQREHAIRFDASSRHHKKQAKHHNKHPCLEGNWNVTSLTLSTSGLTFTGGAGTTVDITSNGNAVGNFTPGAPLVGSEGSAKFNGTVTDHYGFSSKTTATSGSFPVTPVSNDATITVAGVTKPVTSEPESGSFGCSGKNLSLTFTNSGSTLSYHMTSAG